MRKLTSYLHKNTKKGFTLVEVIVVLIIIAIMASLLVPSLTGYIDKAQEKALISEARQFMQGFQVALSETYAFKKIDTSIKFTDLDYPGVKVGKTTNFTFNRIRKGQTASSPESSFDHTLSMIAFDLVEGKQYNYEQSNSNGRVVTTNGNVLFQVTYDAKGSLLKFEFGKDGYYVKFKDGVYTCQKNGKFSSYKE